MSKWSSGEKKGPTNKREMTLEEFMTRFRITHRDMSKALGYKRSGFSLAAKGSRVFNEVHIPKLSKFFGIPVDELRSNRIKIMNNWTVMTALDVLEKKRTEQAALLFLREQFFALINELNQSQDEISKLQKQLAESEANNTRLKRVCELLKA